MAYSAGVSWCCAISSGVMATVAHAGAATSAAATAASIDWKTHQAVGRTHQRVGGALGMRHHPHHVALAAQDAGDVAQRAVGVVQVAEGDAVLRLQFVQRALIGEVAAFAVGDGKAQHLAPLRGGSERRIRGFGAQPHLAADELQPRLRISAPGSRPASTRIWKPLQMPSTSPPSGGELAHRRHHRRELGDSPAPQIVAIGKAAGKDRPHRCRRDLPNRAR